MIRRFSPVLPTLALGAALTLSACTDRMVDIDFRRAHHQEEQEEPVVLQVMPAQAYLEVWGLAGGAFRATEVANRGTYFQGVEAPEPPYWYRFNNQWVFSNEPAVVWEVVAWSRVDIARSVPESSLSLQLSGLAPWLQDGETFHSLVAWGSSAGYTVQVGSDQVPAASEAAEMVLKDQTLEEDALISVLPAFQGEKGDTVHLAQLQFGRVQGPEGASPFEEDRAVSVVRGARLHEALAIPAAGSQAEPAELELDVVLGEGSAHVLDVTSRGNGFDALIADAGGVVDADAQTRVLVRPDLFEGVALPTSSQYPYLSSATFRTPDATGPAAARLTWSDAAGMNFPLQVVFARSYKVNGTTLEAGVVTALGAETSLDVAPLVGAPGSILIDGEEVTADRHISSATPTISWSAPTLGTATGYEVWVTRYTENVGSTSWVVYTAETQVRLPPVFLGGEHQDDLSFAVVVIARSDTTEGFPDKVQAPNIPYGFAASATPRFTAGTR